MRVKRQIVLAAVLLVSVVGVALAQVGVEAQSEPLTCERTLNGLYALASDACAAGPVGYVCNGGSAPRVRPEGEIANSLASVGALVETDLVDAVQTLPIITEVTGGGVAWFRWGDPHYTIGLIVGEVLLLDVTTDDLPPWSSMVVQTGTDRPDCPTTPHNTFVLEPQPNLLTALTVNGVSLEMTGAVAVRTLGQTTAFVALSGQNSLNVRGLELPLWTGQQVVIGYPPGNFATPNVVISETAPLEPSLIEYLPTGLLDQPVWLPQPGYAQTEGRVNLRAEPALDGALIGQVPAGELLTVIGATPSRDWLHVSLSSGYSGWMFAELLNTNRVSINSTYAATPSPPQRYGELNAVARVRAPAGLNIRENPAVQFPAVGTLRNDDQITMIARSPYNAWVKVADGSGNPLGWVALIALDTRANVSALPVDNDVPPPPAPPAPTQIPGAFGNAFPDPNGPSF